MNLSQVFYQHFEDPLESIQLNLLVLYNITIWFLFNGNFSYFRILKFRTIFYFNVGFLKHFSLTKDLLFLLWNRWSPKLLISSTVRFSEFDKVCTRWSILFFIFLTINWTTSFRYLIDNEINFDRNFCVRFERIMIWTLNQSYKALKFL
jgi:hypothetical protein